jgi:hypothetical protein
MWEGIEKVVVVVVLVLLFSALVGICSSSSSSLSGREMVVDALNLYKKKTRSHYPFSPIFA